MNPNLAQNLDPKLKEAYDRVMGTEVGGTDRVRLQASQTGELDKGGLPAQPSNASASSAPTASQSAQPITEAPFVSPQTIKPSESFYSQTVLKPAPAKSDRKISPIIFVAVGIAFFLLYTFIWLKVFSVI